MTAVRAIRTGAALDLMTPASGVVHSVFDRAVNLLVGSGMWALVVDEGHLSPHGICLNRLPAVAMGDRVICGMGVIAIGPWVMDAANAPRWTPAPWHVGPGFDRALAMARYAARPKAWPGTMALVGAILDGMDDGQALNTAVRKAIGCGPGLTPSGDDALIGILAGLMLSGQGPEVAAMARRLSITISQHLKDTTDISRHLLCHAIKGHFSRPLCELGQAILAPGHGTAGAIDRALAVGASSGADACLGLTATLSRVVVLQRAAA